ncbi:MAG: hypothetical protein WD068_01365 [Candidatus Babeliales bacterium]
MKKIIVPILMVMICGSSLQSKVTVACVYTRPDGKAKHYGEKHVSRIEKDSCISKWEDHSYRVEGNRAECRIRRSNSTSHDCFPRIACPDGKTAAECCQDKFLLVPMQMHG